MNVIKNNLKTIRKIRQITQQQLANHLGVSKAMICMWERSSNEKIPQNRIKQIAEFLSVNEDDLLNETLEVKSMEISFLENEIKRLTKRLNKLKEQ